MALCAVTLYVIECSVVGVVVVEIASVWRSVASLKLIRSLICVFESISDVVFGWRLPDSSWFFDSVMTAVVDSTVNNGCDGKVVVVI